MSVMGVEYTLPTYVMYICATEHEIFISVPLVGQNILGTGVYLWNLRDPMAFFTVYWREGKK